jgi:hypothetical protein
MPTVRVRRQSTTLNPLLRWRWDVIGTGMFGYATTKRGAAMKGNQVLMAWRTGRSLR